MKLLNSRLLQVVVEQSVYIGELFWFSVEAFELGLLPNPLTSWVTFNAAHLKVVGGTATPVNCNKVLLLKTSRDTVPLSGESTYLYTYPYENGETIDITQHITNSKEFSPRNTLNTYHAYIRNKNLLFILYSLGNWMLQSSKDLEA